MYPTEELHPVKITVKISVGRQNMNQNLAWKSAYTYFYLKKDRFWRTWITGSGHEDFGLCLTKRKILKLILANKFSTSREVCIA